ncbi:MAG TPA: phosphatase PAP2 family protein [Oscillatoriaceae cyanobacterium]
MTRRSPNTAVAAPAAVAVLCAAGLADVSVEVHKQAVTTPNTEALLDIHAHATNLLVHLSAILQKAASPILTLVLGLIIAGVFFVNRKRLDAWTLAAVLVLSAGSGEVLKKLMHNPRPTMFPVVVQDHGFSFPSGHTTMAFALWGFLAVWVVSQEARQIWRWIMALILVGFAAFVGFSRLVLAVHWPTDVIAGALLGTFWIAAVYGARCWTAAKLAK